MLDLDGYLLLPAPAEPHAHLDKAFMADRVPNPHGRPARRHRGVDANRATPDRRRHRRPGRAGGPAAGGQRHDRHPVARRRRHRPRPAVGRGAGRGPAAPRRPGRPADRGPDRLARHRAGGRRPPGPRPRRPGRRSRRRRRLPAPRRRSRRGPRGAPRAGRRAAAAWSTSTPTRPSIPRCSGSGDLAAPRDDQRVPARRHGQPLRQPRHAAERASSRRSPTKSPPRAIAVVTLPQTNLFLQGRERRVGDAPGAHRAPAAPRRRRHGRRRRRQPAGPVQPRRPGRPARDGRAPGDGRPPPARRGLRRGEHDGPRRAWACPRSVSRPARPPSSSPSRPAGSGRPSRWPRRPRGLPPGPGRDARESCQTRETQRSHWRHDRREPVA